MSKTKVSAENNQHNEVIEHKNFTKTV